MKKNSQNRSQIAVLKTTVLKTETLFERGTGY